MNPFKIAQTDIKILILALISSEENGNVRVPKTKIFTDSVCAITDLNKETRSSQAAAAQPVA